MWAAFSKIAQYSENKINWKLGDLDFSLFSVMEVSYFNSFPSIHLIIMQIPKWS